MSCMEPCTFFLEVLELELLARNLLQGTVSTQPVPVVAVYANVARLVKYRAPQKRFVNLAKQDPGRARQNR